MVGLVTGVSDGRGCYGAVSWLGVVEVGTGTLLVVTEQSVD
jgi:hypothetical protein